MELLTLCHLFAGEIDIGEFVQLMFPSAGALISNLRQNFRSQEDVIAAFNNWDTNHDGQISFSELKAAVSRSGQNLSEEEINSIFVIGDTDHGQSLLKSGPFAVKPDKDSLEMVD